MVLPLALAWYWHGTGSGMVLALAWYWHGTGSGMVLALAWYWLWHGTGSGMVLAHKMPDGTEKPVGYACCTLTKTERNYSVRERGTFLYFGDQMISFLCLDMHSIWLLTTNHC